MGAAHSEGLGPVRNWMSRNLVTVPLGCPVRRVLHLMETQGIRHVLVMDGERLAGIASNRDLRGLAGEAQARLLPGSPVSEVMSENPVTVSAETPLTAAARAMLERKIGALPVLEGTQAIGILTKSDALEALLAWAERAPTWGGAAPGLEARGDASPG
jgi:acetoin utilization protein AcuB